MLNLFLFNLLPPEKLDEMLAGNQQEVIMRARPPDDFRAATVKQRPTSRRITQAEINVNGVFDDSKLYLYSPIHSNKLIETVFCSI